jgi:hypothetical protein
MKKRYENAEEALLASLENVDGTDLCIKCKYYDPRELTMCRGPWVAGFNGVKHHILACTAFEQVSENEVPQMQFSSR